MIILLVPLSQKWILRIIPLRDLIQGDDGGDRGDQGKFWKTLPLGQRRETRLSFPGDHGIRFRGFLLGGTRGGGNGWGNGG